MITPNADCALFGTWLLNISWQSLSGPQRVLVQSITTAALAGTQVTNQEWSNFNKFTAWRFPFYQVYAFLATTSPFILDNYPGAAAAWSFRKLSSTYAGACCRVRRASDNAERDITFAYNTLDTQLLSDFCVGTSGFVSVWYDQSGNGNDAVQATANAQPLIFTAGATILENGKPAITFDGINDYFGLSMALQADTAYSVTQVFNKLAAGNFSFFLSNSSGGSNPIAIFTNVADNIFTYSSSNFFNTALGSNPGFQETIAAVNKVITAAIYNGNTLNANALTASVRNPTFTAIGSIPASGVYSQGKAQELIFWQSDESASIVAIQTAVKDYYGII